MVIKFVGMLFVIVLGSTAALACLCPGIRYESPDEEVRAMAGASSSVFVGEVIAIEYRKGIPPRYMPTNIPAEEVEKEETQVARFKIEYWWGAPLGKEVTVITDARRKPIVEAAPIVTSDGHVIDLLPYSREPLFIGCVPSFSVGKKYLVYADGTGDELRSPGCRRTGPVSGAKEDLRILGKGYKPERANR